MEHSSSFCFTIDQDGKCISAKRPKNILYESGIYPLVQFADELESLNDYCYCVVQSINKELLGIREEVDVHRKNPRDIRDDFATSGEAMLGLESSLYKWEWLFDITAAHLVILLYSYLEKTLKYIFKWYMDKKLITINYRNRKPIINYWLYNILNTDDETFENSQPYTYRVLNEARRMRNNFAHDNLEGVDLNNSDYVYTERKCDPTFKLIDFINSISEILYNVEKVFSP